MSERMSASEARRMLEDPVVFGRKVEAVQAEFLRIMKPAGGIPGIPPLLDQRRLKYAIPNGAFALQAAFDVVLVHQIPRFESETFGNGLIVMPQTSRRRVESETPRGIIVSAGLQALDHLRSNGIDLGHIVSFIRQAPWRMPVEMIAGQDFDLLILRSGDITGSEDLREQVAAGKAKIEWDAEHGNHTFVDQAGKRWDPTLPFLPDDY